MPQTVLYVLIPVVFAVALFASPHIALLFAFPLVLLPDVWNLGGASVNGVDVVLGAILAAYLLRRRSTPRRWIPYRRTWIALGVLLSIAYLVAPANAMFLTDPASVTYQIYRYCWKPILFYPLVATLITDRSKLRSLIVAIVLSAIVCSVIGVLQGYSGDRAGGPFGHGNALGGALVMPFILCFAGIQFSRARRFRVFAIISFLVIARALLFTVSRGAFVAVVAGAGFMAMAQLLNAYGRKALFRLAAVAVVGVVVIFIVKPNPLARPNVARLLTVATQGTSAENFKWREQERWPRFWAKLVERPLFGQGTDVDYSLGEMANTPHNGYLSLALRHGLIASAFYLWFVVRALLDSLRAYRKAADLEIRITGLAIASAIVGVLVHNLVDGVFVQPYARLMLWALVAVGIVAGRARDPFPVNVPVKAAKAPTGRLASLNPVGGRA